MKIALASMPVVNRDMARNLETILKTISQCAGRAGLILFGEAVLQGFDALLWEYEADLHIAVSTDDASIRQVCAAAKAHEIAVSFGYLEKADGVIFSSQLLIGGDGRLVHNFRRVSPGWKEPRADAHYAEGSGFFPFSYGGKRLAIGLCGDLWYPGRAAEMRALDADAVLWPVWCDYDPEQWNTRIKYEYAEQAALCGKNVLLVNPFCADPDASPDSAAGGAVCFRNGKIAGELPSGGAGILYCDC